ncbi:hypothetical protein HanIR_Chr17g0895981 [Helianthus annuus]|nr:hypothetical protein HanIR_Chr17g0895981 [Helianthus annuus]
MITCTFIATGIRTTGLVRGRTPIDTTRLVTHGKPPLIFAHMSVRPRYKY